MRTSPPNPYADARAAMARGAWDEACAHLRASIATAESPEAHEDLGLAAWWLDDATLTFEARERAYMLYRDRRDALGAARVAIWLVWDCLAFRGDFAVASGWLERARRLLADHPHTPEFGWLLLREGEIALFRGHDPATAIALGARAAALGRELGDQSVEFTGLALEGLALVSTGDVAGGMRRLDEASVAATAGEVREPHAVGVVCCWQIFACERLRDYDRAAQWCLRVQEFSRRWGLHPLSAVCSTQYAGVLIWRGEWAAAEAELASASDEIARVRPAMAGPTFARLGELRLRQGRLDEAAALFERAPAQPQARLGMAELLLRRSHADASVALLEESLALLGADELTARAGVLEGLVRARVARGDVSGAEREQAALEEIGAALGTDPLCAAAAFGRGLVLRARRQVAGAQSAFERAVELFQRAGAPFETSRARLELASLLASTGRVDDARRQAERALSDFAALGALGEADRARELLRTLDEKPAPRSRTVSLTARQVEILRLVAQGMSNADIGERLALSEHTVKRHVANVLTRFGLPTRAAAVARAARDGML